MQSVPEFGILLANIPKRTIVPKVFQYNFSSNSISSGECANDGQARVRSRQFTISDAAI